jgi:hypothetical protein
MILSVNWMDGYGNSPNFELSGVEPREAASPYEKRGGLHRRNHGDFVEYFYTDGNPTDGFGGATFEGQLVTGEAFKYRGAWSSRAACVNKLWPEDPVVDVSCGYRATAVCARVLVNEWARGHATGEYGFGLAVVGSGDSNEGGIILPTRRGELKHPSRHTYCFKLNLEHTWRDALGAFADMAK